MPATARALAELRALEPTWRVEIGEPRTSGWIDGIAFAQATEGPFHLLLQRIATRLRTDDRRTVSALFALRFGWVGSAATIPFLHRNCVPQVGLSNLSLKVKENTLFESIAIHQVEGMILDDPAALLDELRKQLLQQAEPVVQALYDWSGFSRKGSWGMITSAWASQFIGFYGKAGSPTDALPVLSNLFAGEDEMARMQPRLNPVSLRDVTHVYQRRASCCRYYLLPQGNLCASCPLVSDAERTRRNLEFMEEQLAT
jgi:ferric iron reductase protein FhuF